MQETTLIFQANQLTQSICTLSNPSFVFIKADLVSNLPALEAINKNKMVKVQIKTQAFISDEENGFYSHSISFGHVTNEGDKQPVIKFKDVKFKPNLATPAFGTVQYDKWETTFTIKEIAFLPDESLYLTIKY